MNLNISKIIFVKLSVLLCFLISFLLGRGIEDYMSVLRPKEPYRDYIRTLKSKDLSELTEFERKILAEEEIKYNKKFGIYINNLTDIGLEYRFWKGSSLLGSIGYWRSRSIGFPLYYEISYRYYFEGHFDSFFLSVYYRHKRLFFYPLVFDFETEYGLSSYNIIGGNVGTKKMWNNGFFASLTVGSGIYIEVLKDLEDNISPFTLAYLSIIGIDFVLTLGWAF